jgi:short-subunit dehydrogenase
MAIPAPRAHSAAFVTGASSGIGHEIARRLASSGHNLMPVARRRVRLEALAAEFPDRRVEIFEADLADGDAQVKLIAALDDIDLNIDIAVLSAGSGMTGPFLEHRAERIPQLVRTNLESTMVLSHALLPAMVARRSGAVLIVSSFAGNQPMPGFGAYAATKAAVTSFGEMLSYEVGRFGVTVSVLAPGGVRTEFSDSADMKTQDNDMPDALVIDVDECASAALEGLSKGQRLIVPRRAVRPSRS